MTSYCVQVIEEHRQDMLIDAKNEEEARQKIIDGEGVEGELHYSHTIDADEWLVCEVK